MKTLFFSALMLVAGLVWAEFDSALINDSSIKNIRQTDEYIFSSGQPSIVELQLLKQAGIKHIINLRPHDELMWDEQAAVESLGMQYHNLAIGDAGDINVANAKKLAALLAQVDGEAVLLHCASGNRVGALVAVISAKLQGNSVDEAMAEGQRWGLSGMAPVVREKLYSF